MTDSRGLERFVTAQQRAYTTALAELRAGSKQTHWMWFIFPQIAGLGISPTARYYAVGSLREARNYLSHPLLGARLRECVQAILPWSERLGADDILGPIDALKLKSCLTLFDQVEPNTLFRKALEVFFGGERDQRTLALLNGQG